MCQHFNHFNNTILLEIVRKNPKASDKNPKRSDKNPKRSDKNPKASEM